MAILGKLSRYQNTGLLLLRLGIGGTMMTHGIPKLIAGPEMWKGVGGAMANLGIHDFPVFWGFMAAFSESVCAMLFVIGFLFRPSCLLLLFTMIVAAMVHITSKDHGEAAALTYGIVFLSMFIIGPGKYSVDRV